MKCPHGHVPFTAFLVGLGDGRSLIRNQMGHILVQEGGETLQPSKGYKNKKEYRSIRTEYLRYPQQTGHFN